MFKYYATELNVLSERGFRKLDPSSRKKTYDLIRRHPLRVVALDARKLVVRECVRRHRFDPKALAADDFAA